MPIRNYVLVGVIAVMSIFWRDYNANYFLAPGIELVTILAVASALLLPRVQAILVPLVVIGIGDMILGNSFIWVFTWSAWAIIAAGALLTRRLHSTKALLLGGAAVGAGSSTFFFIWTNFGVWLQGIGIWTEPTVASLIATYVAGIPFYLTPLAFNVVAVPLAALGLSAIGARSTEQETAPATV